jgi:hypothetical protein
LVPKAIRDIEDQNPHWEHEENEQPVEAMLKALKRLLWSDPIAQSRATP